MGEFPQLVAKRLILDQIKPADISAIVSYAGNIKIVENTRSMPHPYHEEDAISWMNMANQGFKNKDNYIFAMRLKDTHAFVGGIGLTLDIQNNRAELGYWLAEGYWNRGLTTEAVQAILQFGFEELNLNKIIAVYITTNAASGKVMIKNGMVKEGEFKDHDVKKDHTIADDQYVSLIQYRMLKSEYELFKVER
ncbi:GNAT family N-acetyltransferase [Maribacter algarum]|uniref:GNAT family N-acetyltransferase n=1 Tax=Maribacter algarum (ex Zhang et al. 2020) TaxID=2578118 RepID=A0A5S3PQG3_9FLAO|nr:GNAT family N-acetyltransferase [Maribacter algarum]TMM56976.1 GNAT family N-acetyltransferase [Maribacter algarum]